MLYSKPDYLPWGVWGGSGCGNRISSANFLYCSTVRIHLA